MLVDNRLIDLKTPVDWISSITRGNALDCSSCLPSDEERRMLRGADVVLDGRVVVRVDDGLYQVHAA
jgi:hypothetical protein